MEPNGPVRVHLVPFVHSQSYKQIRVHLDPNIHHLAGYPLGLPQGPLGVPGPHFENRGARVHMVKLNTLGFHHVQYVFGSEVLTSLAHPLGS